LLDVALKSTHAINHISGEGPALRLALFGLGTGSVESLIKGDFLSLDGVGEIAANSSQVAKPFRVVVELPRRVKKFLVRLT
jgi:hypothetical protein